MELGWELELWIALSAMQLWIWDGYGEAIAEHRSQHNCKSLRHLRKCRYCYEFLPR